MAHLRRNVDLHLPLQVDDLGISESSFSDRKYDSIGNQETRKFEMMKQDLGRAAEAISSLRKERDSLKEALRKALFERESIEKHYSEKLQIFEMESLNGRKAVHLVDDLKNKTDSLQEELKKMNRVNQDKSRLLAEQEIRIRDLTETVSTQLSGWDNLHTANQNLRKELGSSNYKESEVKYDQASIGALGKIMQYVNYIIEKVHQSPSVYTMFKSRVVCSKKLREIIEKQDFADALLRMLKFIVDLINYYGVRKNSPLNGLPGKANQTFSYNYLDTSKERMAGSLHDSEYLYSTTDRTLKTSEHEALLKRYKSDKLIQTQADKSINTIQDYMTNSYSYSPVTKDVKKSKEKEDDEYSKLIGESQQLLNILDKQNSRLANLNQQISFVVRPVSPMKAENINFIETDSPIINKTVPKQSRDERIRRRNNKTPE